MRNLMFIGMLLVAASMAGWFKIQRDGERTTIEINRTEIRSDAQRAIDRGKELLDRHEQQQSAQQYTDAGQPWPQEQLSGQTAPGQPSYDPRQPPYDARNYPPQQPYNGQSYNQSPYYPANSYPANGQGYPREPAQYGGQTPTNGGQAGQYPQPSQYGGQAGQYPQPTQYPRR